jgi:4-carboxymuconolactone decarboxylase
MEHNGRLPTVKRENLSPEDAQTWDAIAASHRGSVAGPFGALIQVPALAGRVSDLEGYFRFNGLLTPADRELIVIAVTRELGAAFPFLIHKGLAQSAGAREQAIQVVEAQAATDGLTPREGLLIEMARTLCSAHRLSDELYGRLVAELGEPMLVEAVTLAGHYTMISLVVNSFDVQPPLET